jgi:hypothetical protein
MVQQAHDHIEEPNSSHRDKKFYNFQFTARVNQEPFLEPIPMLNFCNVQIGVHFEKQVIEFCCFFAVEVKTSSEF